MVSTNPCPLCDQKFKSTGSLRDHAWAEHNACHYCGDTIGSTDVESLYKHWLTTHPEDLTNVDENRAKQAVDSIDTSEKVNCPAHGGAELVSELGL